MSDTLADQIMQKIKEAETQRYRLILVVSPTGSGITTSLQEVKKRVEAPLININLKLSRQMLELTEHQRSLELSRLVTEFMNDAGNGTGNNTSSEIVLFDNTEILFDTSLRQDPLKLLTTLSRNKTLVAAWNGSIEGNHIVYATPNHPEYRRYERRDFLAVSREAKT